MASQLLGCPLVASSANRKGKPAPGTRDKLDPDLMDLVDAVVDGTCSSGISSTVLDLTVHPVSVLREGKLTRAMLRHYIPDVT